MFQRFTSVNTKHNDVITISKTNSFGFPTHFFNKNEIGKFRYVVLFYDDTSREIGFLFTDNQDEPNKFTIFRNRSGQGGSVVAKSFFDTYDIKPMENHGKYLYEKREVPEIGLLYIIKLPNIAADITGSSEVPQPTV